MPRRTAATPTPAKGRTPIIAEGYDVKTGTWDSKSPAGMVIQAVRIGSHLNAAAGYAGVSRASLFGWLARGREYQPDSPYRREEIPADQRLYLDFLDAVTRSDSSFEVELTGYVLKAAKADNKFALAVLSKRYAHWRTPAVVQVVEPVKTVAENEELQNATILEALKNAPDLIDFVERLDDLLAGRDTIAEAMSRGND